MAGFLVSQLGELLYDSSALSPDLITDAAACDTRCCGQTQDDNCETCDSGTGGACKNAAIDISGIDLSCNASCDGDVTGCTLIDNGNTCDDTDNGCCWDLTGSSTCSGTNGVQIAVGSDDNLTMLFCLETGGAAWWYLRAEFCCTASGCQANGGPCGVGGTGSTDGYAIWRAPRLLGQDCPETDVSKYTLIETSGLDTDPSLDTISLS